MKSTTAIAKQGQTIIVDELVMDEGHYARIELTRIRISPDNRKRFNPQKLQELAESIKDMGVAQPVLLRPVTPTDLEPQEFEIVAGERRYRASTIAGMLDIPAMVRILTDLQAAKIRILENLQREDPHPMEEAEGYQQLMLQHGYTADQLVGEIKKSRSYVFGRLKLCSLTTEVREQFLDDKISASIALLIARIPVPALQLKALGEIVTPQYGEPLSVRKAAEHLQGRYMLDLTSATFPIADAKLLATAGSCTKCPKRTGNQPEIYEGISADVCTDPDCFGEKKAALITRRVADANKKGIPVLEGQDEWKALAKSNNLVMARDQLYEFERCAPDVQNWRPLGALIASDQLPAPKAYAMISNDLVPLYEKTAVQQALEKAGVCETEEGRASREAEEANTTEGQAGASQHNEIRLTHLRKEAAAQTESAYRIALYKQLRSRASNGFSLESLRTFAKLVLMDQQNEYSLPSDVLDIYGLESQSDVAVCAYIDRASLPEVQLILVDLVLGKSLGVHHWDIDAATFEVEDEDDDIQFGALREMARHEGIDPDQVKLSMKMAALSVSDVDADNLHDFLKLNPDRIDETTAFILADRPHLVGALEFFAKELGYAYNGGTFAKPVAAISPETAATEPPSSEVGATIAQLEDQAVPEGGDAVALDGEDLADAIGERPAAPMTKKTPKAAKKIAPATPTVKQVLAPAGAWPWPTSSRAALAPAASTKSTEANPSTKEAS